MMALRVTMSCTKPWRNSEVDLASNPLHGAMITHSTERLGAMI